jgi:hypothetical protein
VSWPERSGRHELENTGHPTRHAGTAIALGDQDLLHELWLISHFGWIAEATIARGLMISGAREVLTGHLGDRLRLLLNRGWVERRYTDGGTDEPEWRLTDGGRDALAHRA